MAKLSKAERQLRELRRAIIGTCRWLRSTTEHLQAGRRERAIDSLKKAVDRLYAVSRKQVSEEE